MATTVTETKAEQNHNELNDKENNESINDQITVEIDNDLPIQTETTQDIIEISQEENKTNAIEDKDVNVKEEIELIPNTEQLDVNNFPPPPLELYDTKDDAPVGATENNSVVEASEINVENSDANKTNTVKESPNNESEGCNLIDTPDLSVHDSLHVIELQDDHCNVIDSVISPPSTYSDAPTTPSNPDQIDETQDNEHILESHSMQDIPPPLMCHEDSSLKPISPPPLEDTPSFTTNEEEANPENIAPLSIEDSFFSLPSEDSVLPPPLEDSYQTSVIEDPIQTPVIEDPVEPPAIKGNIKSIPLTDNDSSTTIEKPISPPPEESSPVPLKELSPQCSIEPPSPIKVVPTSVDEAAAKPNPWHNAESVDCYLSSEESDSENLIQESFHEIDYRLFSIVYLLYK